MAAETLALSDVNNAVFGPRSSTRDRLDLLRYVAENGSDSVVEKVTTNEGLRERFSRGSLRRQTEQMLENMDEEVRHLGASREFGARVEKQGWGRWALQKAKALVLSPVKFVIKHPFMATALTAAGVLGAFYLAGYWEQLMTAIGAEKMAAIGESATELAPVTPSTPPLPGGGAYEIQPPMPAPGEFPHVPL